MKLITYWSRESPDDAEPVLHGAFPEGSQDTPAAKEAREAAQERARRSTRSDWAPAVVEGAVPQPHQSVWDENAGY